MERSTPIVTCLLEDNMQWPQLGNGKDTDEFYQTVGCPSFIAQHLINDCYYPSAQSRVQIMCK